MSITNVEYHAYRTRNEEKEEWECRVDYTLITGPKEARVFEPKRLRTKPFAKRWMALEAAEGLLQAEEPYVFLEGFWHELPHR